MSSKIPHSFIEANPFFEKACRSAYERAIKIRRKTALGFLIMDSFDRAGARCGPCSNCHAAIPRGALVWRRNEHFSRRGFVFHRLCLECCKSIAATWRPPRGSMAWPPVVPRLPSKPRKKVLVPGKVRPKRYSWEPAAPKKRRKVERWPTPG